jgi:hypothetical protein
MRRYKCSALVWSGVLGAAGLLATAGCSSGDQATTATSSSAATSTEESLTPGGPPLPGATGVSPGGVTTKVDVPAESTEDEYFQACHAAKVWMDGQPGDPQSLVEPYLKTLQTSGTSGPATFNTPWSQLNPARQAAVIVAVQAAADAACG